ncbi:hypothetical protein RRG08_033991 [Elysia crispata]|uniref:Uncharacterized protein n=1 Tax=Elysia crispata TaxID=231223 RepID=A0AAE0XS39_9GAST|nr:hypothetical protein RRG08_033991 [Elysia crispata]
MVSGDDQEEQAFLVKSLPRKKKHIPLGESTFLFRHETTLVSFQSKRQKNVLLLSTMHNKAEIERRATFPSHYEIIRQDIACVLKSLCPEPQPAPQHPPAKAAKTDRPAKKQKRCSYCPAKKDRKEKLSAIHVHIHVNGTFAKITLCSSARIVHSSVEWSHFTQSYCILVFEGLGAQTIVK